MQEKIPIETFTESNQYNLTFWFLNPSYIVEFVSIFVDYFLRIIIKEMDIIEASAKTKCPDEKQDLMDDHLMHRDEEAVVEEAVVEETLTNDIEKDPPVKPKRPRTKKQQEAFKKAQIALKVKREKEKEAKASAPKKPRGRPAKAKPKPKKQPKVIFEESSSSSSSSSSESEQEVVYVQRRKKAQRKPRKPKAPRVVYVTDSSEEEHESEVTGAPPDWFKFV